MRMRTIYFRWWRGKNNAGFTTLHLTRDAAEDHLAVGLICWKSRPEEKVYTTTITEEEHKKLTMKLAGKEGVRLQLDDLKK